MFFSNREFKVKCKYAQAQKYAGFLSNKLYKNYTVLQTVYHTST